MTRCVAGVVLKIAPPPGVEVTTYERGAMSIELNTLELIRTHTSVPVPAVHFADRSHEVCDADHRDHSQCSALQGGGEANL